MLQLQGHDGTVHALAFSPGGQTLFSAGRDGTVRMWDLGSVGASTVLRGHSGPVQCLALHERGQVLASGSGDGKVLVWDVRQTTLLQPLHRQMAGVTGLAWLPGRSTLLASSGERLRPERGGEIAVVFHDGSHSEPKLGRLEEHGIWSMAVAARAPVLAWGGGARRIAAWDITRQEPRFIRQTHPCLAVAVSPDGRWLAAAVDRTIKVLDLSRGREVATLDGHKGLVRTLAFSPDGRTFASAGLDQAVRFWTLGETVHEARRFEWPIGKIAALAFSPDGLLAAAAGESGNIILWDIDD